MSVLNFFFLSQTSNYQDWSLKFPQIARFVPCADCAIVRVSPHERQARWPRAGCISSDCTADKNVFLLLSSPRRTDSAPVVIVLSITPVVHTDRLHSLILRRSTGAQDVHISAEFEAFKALHIILNKCKGFITDLDVYFLDLL